MRVVAEVEVELNFGFLKAYYGSVPQQIYFFSSYFHLDSKITKLCTCSIPIKIGIFENTFFSFFTLLGMMMYICMYVCTSVSFLAEQTSYYYQRLKETNQNREICTGLDFSTFYFSRKSISLHLISFQFILPFYNSESVSQTKYPLTPFTSTFSLGAGWF